jgi:hypothetical protein
LGLLGKQSVLGSEVLGVAAFAPFERQARVVAGSLLVCVIKVRLFPKFKFCYRDRFADVSGDFRSVATTCTSGAEVLDVRCAWGKIFAAEQLSSANDLPLIRKS